MAAFGPGSIGIDAEQWNRVDPHLATHILGPDERRAHQASHDGRIDRLALALAFAAKEAFYKAQWPRTRRYLGFEAASVSANAAEFTLTLEQSVPDLGPRGASFIGRHVLLGPHLLAAITL